VRRLMIAAAILLCFYLSSPTFAQTTNATVGGTVSDATGALIPGVEITATNTQTGIINTTLTNESGAYQFASLQSGSYKFSANLAGFQPHVSDIVLGVSQQVRLNFTLPVAAVGTEIDVTETADSVLATTSASVGSALSETQVSYLPLATRNVLDLIQTTAGSNQRDGFNGAFAGNRTSAANVTLNGVVVTDGRNDAGASSVTNVTPDLVEEVRIIVSPADAEMGRGSGQVQLVTRSGTNQFRGSAFWTNGNSAFNANTWRNNLEGREKNYQNRNQYGFRLGGPIVKNKTFFFFLFEGNRVATREYVTGPVLTAEARQGIFRYYPGVQNGNAISSNPTVDVNGNPVTPIGATGPLTQFSVFGPGRDTFRPGFDPSGYMQALIAKMPLPNDFTTGDGLNTAGIRFVRRMYGYDQASYLGGGSPDVNRDQFNIRLDHNFNQNHKLSFSASLQKDTTSTNPTGVSIWPDGFNGWVIKKPHVYSLSLVSTLSPTMVNEFRFGNRDSSNEAYTAVDKKNPKGFFKLPENNSMPYIPRPVLFPNNLIGTGSSRGNTAPLWSYADTLSTTKGLHAFKFGGEVRFISNPGFVVDDPPQAFFGAGSVAVTGIDGTIPGLIGANQTTARNLLIDLAGSIGNVRETFNISSPSDKAFKNYLEMPESWRYWHSNEFSAFFKDDWKVRPSLTLNLGVRYDWYGVPYDDHGFMAAPVGGSKGLFGISGTSYADMYQPGRLNGSLTVVEFVGKDSPNPDRKIYKDDWNNFGPAVGVSWSPSFLGKDKTVFRAGYGISYQHAAELRLFNADVGRIPGVSNRVMYTPATYQSLANLSLPVPNSITEPLKVIPLTERTQTLNAWDSNTVSPYVQNFNFEIQRELATNLTVEARYIGSKGTKLFGGIPLNNVNIFESGILEAFNNTRAGGNAPLFDKMLNGLNLGLGPINGTTVTGSASLRNNTLSRAFLANGDVGQFADFLNRSTTVTGQGGGLIRNGGFPENLIVVNPQFAIVSMYSNPGNSTYHSMQLQLTKRGRTFNTQASYTWSRALGEQDLDERTTYLDPRNRSLNKTLLGFNRTHDFRANGSYQLPFGPNQRFLSSAPGWVSRLVENWRFSTIFGLSSGVPLSIIASTSSVTEATVAVGSSQVAFNRPDIVGDFPKSSGKVTKVPGGAMYFAGLRQVVDPEGATVTPLQGLNSNFSNLAIADSSGRLLLVNPAPGKVGTLGSKWIEGPGSLRFDINLDKRITVAEKKELEFRVDILNALNHPNFDNPVSLDINDINFGRIQSATGNRLIVIGARVNF
jgi:hypothetical protein